MFERELTKVKEYLDKIGARYQVVVTNGYEQVYVFDKDACEKKDKNPRKYKNLYVSYLRISKPEDGRGLYTRNDGICGYANDEKIKKIIDGLTGI